MSRILFSISLPLPIPLPLPSPEWNMYKSFRDMPIWCNAMETAEKIFIITDHLPKKEDYGFTSQIRRSALSISANIAEAFGREHSLDKINFYYYSRGSITETQSHLEYGYRVRYLSKENLEEINKILDVLYNDINKIIIALKHSRVKEKV